MEALILNYEKSKIKRIARIFLGLYFFLFSAYFVFTEAAIDRFDLIFYIALVGMFSALLLFLGNTLWVTEKKLLIIDSKVIESNIRRHKFKIEWVNVSNVIINYSSISFYVDGGRKHKMLDLSEIYLKDIEPIIDKVEKLCEHKSIAYNKE